VSTVAFAPSPQATCPRARPLTVIFARRHDARREEDGPAALAGPVTRVRNGEGRRTAGAGERRGGSGPRRCAAALEAAGQAAAPQRRDSPATPAASGAAPSTVHAFPLVITRAYAESPARARRPGAPWRALEIYCEESPHRQGSTTARTGCTVQLRLMCDAVAPLEA